MYVAAHLSDDLLTSVRTDRRDWPRRDRHPVDLSLMRQSANRSEVWSIPLAVVEHDSMGRIDPRVNSNYESCCMNERVLHRMDVRHAFRSSRGRSPCEQTPNLSTMRPLASTFLSKRYQWSLLKMVPNGNAKGRFMLRGSTGLSLEGVDQ